MLHHPRSSAAALLLAGFGLAGCGGKSTEPATGSGSVAGDSPLATVQASEWAGHTYLLSLAKTDWAEPRGVGVELFGIAPAFIFKVTEAGTALTATLATAPATYSDPADPDTKELPVTPDEAVQEPCGVTTEIPFSGQGYPESSIAPSTNVRMFVRNVVAAPAVQITAPVYDLKFTDVLPKGGVPSTTGTLEATMDFRQLYVLFTALGPTRTPESVCRSLYDAYTPSSCTDPSCEVKCKPCPDGAAYCFTVKAEGIGAVEAPNLDVTEITEASRPATCSDTTS